MADLPKTGVGIPKAFVSISIDIDPSSSGSDHGSTSSEQVAAIESVTRQLIAQHRSESDAGNLGFFELRDARRAQNCG